MSGIDDILWTQLDESVKDRDTHWVLGADAAANRLVVRGSALDRLLANHVLLGEPGHLSVATVEHPGDRQRSVTIVPRDDSVAYREVFGTHDVAIWRDWFYAVGVAAATDAMRAGARVLRFRDPANRVGFHCWVLRCNGHIVRAIADGVSAVLGQVDHNVSVVSFDSGCGHPKLIQQQIDALRAEMPREHEMLRILVDDAPEDMAATSVFQRHEKGGGSVYLREIEISSANIRNLGA